MRKIRVSSLFIEQALTVGNLTNAVKCKEGLPKGSKLDSIKFNKKTKQVELIFELPKEVEDGRLIELDAVFKTEEAEN